MKQTWACTVATAGVCLLVATGTGCEKLKARDELNKGVQSFKGARYPDAVNHFRQAVDLDPTYPSARLYLATAYMSQWIPGADSPDNNKFAQNALDQFNKVLEGDPKNSTAIASIASLTYNQAKAIPSLEGKLKKLDEAKEWYKKLVDADPKSKEGYYSLGVIAWEKWYPAYLQARQKLGMKPDDPGPMKDTKQVKVKQELKDKYSAELQEGVDNLNKALAIDPEYDDAMAYLNLIIRQRADLQDSPQAYKQDIATADNWVQKALDTKKIKAARVNKQPGGIVLEDAKK